MGQEGGSRVAKEDMFRSVESGGQGPIVPIIYLFFSEKKKDWREEACSVGRIEMMGRWSC